MTVHLIRNASVLGADPQDLLLSEGVIARVGAPGSIDAPGWNIAPGG